MDVEIGAEKNKTVTFRIDKQVLDKIKSHASFERITLNALVNQILAHAVDWDIVAAK
jgi:predicted HicB family RNase H-like nuclease